MKKFLQYFLIVPIIFIAIFSFFACGEEEIKSIDLSITPSGSAIINYEDSKNDYFIDKNLLSSSGTGEKRVILNVKIEPNNFTVNNLQFDINNIGDRDIVSEIRIRPENVFIIFGDRIGQCNITASYTRNDNKKISSTIRLFVSDKKTNLRFSEDSYITTYTGEPLENNYRVEGDEIGNFNYSFQKIDTDKENALIDVDEIVNVGRYLISCVNPDVPDSETSTILTVNKYRFTFTGNDYQACYGDSLPEDLFYELGADVPSNVLYMTQAKYLYGIGKDAGSNVGRYVEVTSAYTGSNVGIFPTTFKMNLRTDYLQNYETEYDVEEGSFRIVAKEVVLKGVILPADTANRDHYYYGDSTKNSFELYSYDEYLENEKDITKCTLLNTNNNQGIEYAKDISLGNPIYKVDGVVAERNSVGELDVLIVRKEGSDFDEYGSYEVTFDNATTGRNLILKEVLEGSLTIEPREIEILPTKNQSKDYGAKDPEVFTYSVVKGSIVNHDNIINPLSIIYKSAEEGGLGEGNYLADAGKYYYCVDDSLNPNYYISLDKRALEEEDGVLPEEKVTFEIKVCPIIIKLKDKTDRYKTPTGIVDNGVKYHTVGYYGDAEDYKLEIESLTIGGKDADLSTIESGALGQKGQINFETGGKFYFEINVNIVENSNFFISYEVYMPKESFHTIDANGANYDITLLTSNLNLTKSKVIITPNDTNFKKVFDATNDDSNLFREDLGVYYTATDEFGNELRDIDGNIIRLQDIVVNSESLLTLVENNEYSKLKSDGTYEKVLTFKDVGKYKIYLIDEISYRDGMEFYQLVLDDTRDYNYEIVKATVSITVNPDQTKVYGSLDPIFRYEFSNLPNNDDPEITGRISRVAGENVGDYQYSLGTGENRLSFGDNYELILIANAAMFTITPRTITVKPYSASYVYGEDAKEPLYNFVIEDGYDRNIVGNISSNTLFTGKFYIVSDKEDPTSVVVKDSAGFYPVNIKDGNVISYIIIQGDFTSATNNYIINFIEDETYTITKRDITINITSQQRESLGTVETEMFPLAKDQYSVSNLVGNVNTNLEVLLNVSNNYYCSVKKDDSGNYQFALNITLNGENVNNNYNVIMGSDVVYLIDTAIVYLSIVDREKIEQEVGEETSTIVKTFMGEAFDNSIFKLISKTEDYEIDYESSIFRFIYRSSAYSGDAPENAGSYVASLDLTREGDQLVLINKNAQTEENRKIIFTNSTLATRQGNVIISISSLGYFNILRAQITIKNSPEFESDFTYGDTYLPKLRLATQSNHAIFEGVNGAKITLREYDFKDDSGNVVKDSVGNIVKVNYQGSGYSISNFQANYTYNIMVSIQAIKDGVVDSNYETLIIPAVPLRVIPREMKVETSIFKMRNNADADLSKTTITYDGTLKSLNLILTLNNNAPAYYTTTYSYQKLAVAYSETNGALEAIITYRVYDKENKTLKDGVNQMPFSGLPKISSFEIREDSGNRYLIINNDYAVVMQSGNSSGVSPDNAGLYVCISTCNAYENYTFAVDNTASGISSTIQYATTFEIKKSSDITFDLIKEWKFYYSTRFDFNNQSSLPFNQKDENNKDVYYSIYPSSLRQYVVISMNLDGLSTSGYLNVGDYTARLTINTDNYYWNKDQSFTVEKLRVEFVFPVLKNYVYIGQNVKVDSFLSNIRVVRKDNEGNPTESFYYDPNSSQSAGIVLTYYKRDEYNNIIEDTATDVAPYDIGSYTLVMVYGTEDVFSKENYFGSGSFEYDIIPRSFTGSLRVENAVITYSSLYKQEYFYDEIIKRMFTIDIYSGYKITLYQGKYDRINDIDLSKIIEVKKDANGKEIIDYSNITSPEQLGWLREINSAGQHFITFVIEFDDVNMGSVVRNAVLTVKKKSLSLDDFDGLNSDVNKVFTYDGFPKFNPIFFGNERDGIKLDPLSDDYDKLVGEYFYHFRSVKTEKGDEYVTLLDNMFNVIFELRYTFEDRIGQDLKSVPPIRPDTNYKVYYNIIGGACYTTTGLGSPFNLFTISPIDILYISIKDLGNLNLYYTGENLLSGIMNDRRIGDNLLINQINVRRDDSTSAGVDDVYYTLYSNDRYLEEYGVYLEIFFTNSKGEIVDEIIDAGTYYMNLAVAYTSNYEIIDYFGRIRIGTSSADTVETINLERAVVDGILRHWYDKVTSVEFVVHGAKPPYSAENYTDVFGFQGLSSTPQIKDGVIEIETELDKINIKIVDGQQDDITLDIQIHRANVYSQFATITGDQSASLTVKDNNGWCRYRVIIKNSNYEDTYIDIVFKSPQS